MGVCFQMKVALFGVVVAGKSFFGRAQWGIIGFGHGKWAGVLQHLRPWQSQPRRRANNNIRGCKPSRVPTSKTKEVYAMSNRQKGKFPWASWAQLVTSSLVSNLLSLPVVLVVQNNWPFF